MLSLADLANIAQIVEALVALVILLSAVVIARDIRESVKARHLDGIRYVQSLIGTEEASENRRWVYQELEKVSRPLTSENDAKARAIGRDFDHIGFLCRHGLVPTKLIVEIYNQNIVNMWDRLYDPFIVQWRHRDDDYFAEFEWLAKNARKAKGRIEKKHHRKLRVT